MQRCHWAGQDPMMCAYHDHEWGTPLHDDRALFEFLCLEGAQAGLSWRTVLAKRERYREVFHGFAIDRVAAMSDAEVSYVANRISNLPAGADTAGVLLLILVIAAIWWVWKR